MTRALEIISEASRRLPDDMKARHPDIPWNEMAGAGNVYRHKYETVDEAMIWHTMRHDLEARRGAATGLPAGGGKALVLFQGQAFRVWL